MKIFSNKFYFIIVAVFVFANLANAQDLPPPQQPPPPPGPPVVPIDGSLTVFIVVTVFFGLYMIYKNIKNQTPSGN
jgi:hypothetical protein